MNHPRILGRAETNYYHVMSRVVDRNAIFGENEKRYFKRLMRKLEAFMGIRILTYCLMSNHFHLLLEVPKNQSIDDAELLRRLENFYSPQQFKGIQEEYEWLLAYSEESGNDIRLQTFRDKYLARIGDLSIFTKELKENFSRWYNRRSDRTGTLWEARFKSVLIENTDRALSIIAAYIDLNPVRAGIIEDPKDYAFCGYAEAVRGSTLAQKGVLRIWQTHDDHSNVKDAMIRYRVLLYAHGGETEQRKGFSPEQIRKTFESGGKLSIEELIRCRIRYFNDGLALGSKTFIEQVFSTNRLCFGPKRAEGARTMHGGDWKGLFSMRQLVRQPISPPKSH